MTQQYNNDLFNISKNKNMLNTVNEYGEILVIKRKKTQMDVSYQG